MKELLTKGALLVACLTITGGAVVPAPALAQSSAFYGAAVGAIVGTLLFDSNTNRYYYYNGPRRYYVSNYQAQAWYQRRDPQYWRAHRQYFQRSPGQFSNGWNQYHHGRPPM